MTQAFQDGQPSEIYASASGMVGAPNSAGAWAAWIPPEGSDFLSIYGDGTTHRVVNMGGGKYAYSANNGPARVYAYAPRWLTSRYYDAAGNPISGVNDARAGGEPVAAYHQTGVLSSSGGTGGATSTPSEPASWTRSSDGRTDIWAGASGMAGVQNSRNAWAIFVPLRGLTIESRYGGHTWKIQNQGDGTYTLQIDGGSVSLRAYPQALMSSPFFDAQGRPIARAEDASAQGDPIAQYMTPGPAVSTTSGGGGGSTRPTTPVVSTPLPPISTPVDTGGGGGGGSVIVPGGGGIPVSPFPDPVTVAPEAPQSKAGGLAVLAAIGAALSLFN